ncbi:Protein of unknown function (DUF3168) [Hoeflea sp. IMCC20628]|uniref:DUF3168 domain-containing protein n=1 Tax=Hoeflea sp. IMCC20628 TaxID=1620421 RepID=UPI00063AA7DE|nr:DUF3168 domain-containing protein [Hoeflea sp. IMCC20628]AKI01432.1 Protein of unknown function (DUF3168) [Hoeflea sp. IMCC20628]
MIEPTLALQSAIRSALTASPDVTALVPADHIRSGSTRPEKLPTIIMSNGRTMFLGNASGSQYIARVLLDLHIWALEDGADTAQAIGFAVCTTLKTAPDAADFSFDEFSLPAVRWMRDPDPDLSYTHGVVAIEAVIRWTV